MNQKRTAQNINTLGVFCGRRDISALTTENLKNKYGFPQVDVMVLFGGSILCGGDVLAKAMQDGIAKKYIIVGGAGHTTETLRFKMRQQFPSIETAGLPEAKIFASYLKYRYGLVPDFLECDSTNCGNNITNLLNLLNKHNIIYRSIILCQDATMQLRMDAGLRKYCPADTIIINYASYSAIVAVKENHLVYTKEIWGIWDMKQYITLLMVEIPRLNDNVDGYGPNGKNYISHVDIPQKVLFSFNSLQTDFRGWERDANPLYASKM